MFVQIGQQVGIDLLRVIPRLFPRMQYKINMQNKEQAMVIVCLKDGICLIDSEKKYF